MIKLTSNVLNIGNIVSATLTIEPQLVYGYGYGYNNGDGSYDFFDVFGLEGDKLGRFFDYAGATLGYGYGFGYEYTQNICSDDRSRKFTLTVSPSGIYDVKIYVKGQGESDIASGTTDSGGVLEFEIQDSETHTDFMNIFLHDELDASGINHNNQSQGTTFISERNSFIDIIVDISNTYSANKLIKLTSDVVSFTGATSKIIKLTAQVG
jgi:hypothetical protein